MSALNYPKFQVGSYNVDIEHPSNWSLKHVTGENMKNTLGGQTMTDILYRKYEYSLKYDAMSKTDYDNLLLVMNYALDNDAEILFTYNKWTQTQEGVYVNMRLSDRGFRGGQGNVLFYSGISVELIEIYSRT
jgi:hypothetical protein